MKNECHKINITKKHKRDIFLLALFQICLRFELAKSLIKNYSNLQILNLLYLRNYLIDDSVKIKSFPFKTTLMSNMLRNI